MVNMPTAAKSEPVDEDIHRLTEQMRLTNEEHARKMAALNGEPIRRGLPGAPLPAHVARPTDDERAFDFSSKQGRFGWTKLEDTFVPYIFREGEKYCPVRMTENKVLFLALSRIPADIVQLAAVASHPMTDPEAFRFNDVLKQHYGDSYSESRRFLAQKDLLVRLDDLVALVAFADVVTKKLSVSLTGLFKDDGGGEASRRCGFVLVGGWEMVAFVGLRLPGVADLVMHCPLFMFECDGPQEYLRAKAVELRDWDLNYLKFCCGISGILPDLIDSSPEYRLVVPLDEVKALLPDGTSVEECWPVAKKGGGWAPVVKSKPAGLAAGASDAENGLDGRLSAVPGSVQPSARTRVSVVTGVKSKPSRNQGNGDGDSSTR